MSEYAGLEATTELVSQLKAITGDKELLDTTDKSTLVAAINELYNSIFDYDVVTTFDAVEKYTTKLIKSNLTNVYVLSDGTFITNITHNSGNYIYTSTDAGATWTKVFDTQDISLNSSVTLFPIANAAVLMLSTKIYKSIDKGATWVDVTPSGSTYNVTKASITSNGTIVFRSNNNYYSTDNGDTFVQSSNNTVGSISAYSNNTTKIVASIYNSGNVAYSTDNGDTWVAASTAVPYKITAICVTSTNVIIVSTSRGMYYSTDNGDTWVAATTYVADVVSLWVTSNNIIIARRDIGVIYKSIDNGDTWTQCSISGVTDVAILSNSVIANASDAIYYSSNDGDTWTVAISRSTDIMPTGNFLHVNNSTVYIYNSSTTTNNNILRSTNNGAVFTAFKGLETSTGNLGSVLIKLNNGILLSDTHRSSDDGDTWEYLPNNLTEINAVTATGKIIAGLNNNNNFDPLIYSIDNGVTWSTMSLHSQSATSVTALHVTDTGVILCALANNSIYKSIDDGVTWTLVSVSGLNTPAIHFVSYNNIIVMGTGKLVSGTYTGDGLLYSNDNGVTWNSADSNYGYIEALNVSSQGRFIAVSHNNYVYHSDDGAFWVPGLSVSSTICFGITTTEHNIILLLASGVYYSDDNGVTWTASSAIELRNTAVLSNNIVIAGTYNSGIYYSIDEGITWEQSSITTGQFRDLISTGDTVIASDIARADTLPYYICTVTTEVDPTSVKPKWETAIEQLASQLNT